MFLISLPCVHSTSSLSGLQLHLTKIYGYYFIEGCFNFNILFLSRVKAVATINRSALVMHSAPQMYALVNDVERYPEFLDGCVKVDLIEHTPHSMTARLYLAKAGLSYEFVTCNTLLADEKITLELQQGPFDYLRGSWQFTPLRHDACKVEMALEFGVTGLKGRALSGLFSPIAASMVEAFCSRADNVYK